MATRTEPIPMCSFSYSQQALRLIQLAAVSVGVVMCVGHVLARGLRVRAPLGSDQLVQPADFALYRLQSVPLQLEGVAVDALPGPCEARAERLDPLLKPAAPAFPDPEPDVCRGPVI